MVESHQESRLLLAREMKTTLVNGGSEMAYTPSVEILKDVIDLEGQLTDEIVVASGDYFYRDEEGYFYFVSRHDDMIKTRGFRVSPYEVESVVRENITQIDLCAVFAIENELI
jgi:acyl-coenzyme A synthetase/AMP-(fatty) acid ligase